MIERSDIRLDSHFKKLAHKGKQALKIVHLAIYNNWVFTEWVDIQQHEYAWLACPLQFHVLFLIVTMMFLTGDSTTKHSRNVESEIIISARQTGRLPSDLVTIGSTIPISVRKSRFLSASRFSVEMTRFSAYFALIEPCVFPVSTLKLHLHESRLSPS